ncbi:MAG: hypothetical protein ABI822_19965, partial [Bryobacteraceae bacterium]
MKFVVLIWIALSSRFLAAQQATTQASVPRTWETRALSDWATPVANIHVRPGHFSEDEYYGAPVDNYRTYPVYLPDREPAGYWERLRNQKPEALIDLSSIGPSFHWAAAGKRVWEEIDVPFFRLYDAESISMARSSDYMRKKKDRVVALVDGTLAIYRWVVTPQGIALGVTACASCHTRVLDDGTTITGPGISRRTSDALLDRMFERAARISYSGDGPQMAAYRQFGVPWLPDDIHQRLKTMSDQEVGQLFDAQVPGVTDR